MDPAAARDLIERERTRLRECGAEPLGALAWAALADALRREGRLEAAEVIARSALESAPGSAPATLALALALLEQGRIAEARDELARGLEGTAEVREAFERIQSWAALAALSAVEADAASEEAEVALFGGIDPLSDDDDLGAGADSLETDPELFGAGAPFATETMAGLLEQQGLVDDARALRDRLVARSDDVPASGVVDEAFDARAAWRARVLSTLERWLDNLRKDVA